MSLNVLIPGAFRRGQGQGRNGRGRRRRGAPGGALPDAVSEVDVPAAGSAVVDDPAVVAVERARQVPAARTTPR